MIGVLGAFSWRWIPVLAFPIYLWTFSHARVLERAVDTIADADTGAFVLLLTEWSPGRRYGDAWNTGVRSVADQAQEHKIKHSLLPFVVGPFSTTLTAVGVPRLVAAKLPIAVFGSLALAMVGLTLANLAVRPMVTLTIVLLMAAAPFHWVYSSLPDSWVFSGLLTLIIVRLHLARRDRAALVGAACGLAMTNNITLGALCVLPLVASVQAGTGLRGVVIVGGRAVGAALATWGFLQCAASLIDPELRPDRVVAFMRFFPSLLEASPVAPWHPGAIRVSIEQWLVTSLASAQANPRLVGWGLGETLRGSAAGVLAVSAVVALWGGGLLGVARRLPDREAGASLARVAGIAVAALLLWATYHVSNARTLLFYTPVVTTLVLLPLGVALNRYPPRFDRLWLALVACTLPAALYQLAFLYAYLG